MVVGKDFADAARLASYAGIAPVTRRSGTSIRGEAPSPPGEQDPQACAVPLSVRVVEGFPSIQGILRPEAR